MVTGKKESKKTEYDFDVFGINSRFEGFDERIRQGMKDKEGNIISDLLPENKEAVLSFKRRVYASGLMGKKRILKYEVWFRNYDHYLKKPFNQATREDLEDVLAKVKDRSDWKDSVKADFHIMLKRYYKINLGDPDDTEYPDLVKWIKSPKVEYPPLNFDDCPTWEDVLKMSEHCLNLRDKALVTSIWEAGMRIGEALTLKVGSVEEVQHGLYLNVQQSKTKKRPVFIKLSGPIILSWLTVHPLKNDKEAPLFCHLEDGNYRKALGYRYAVKLNERLKRSAGIKKDVNPHMLRHGSASYFSDVLSDSDMDLKYGWAFGSPHKRRYQHKHQKGIESKILKLAGIYDDTGVKNIYEEGEKEAVECYYCKEKNPKDNKTCWRCKRILDISMAEEVQKLKEKVDDISLEILGENPQVLKSLVDRMAQEVEGKARA